MFVSVVCSAAINAFRSPPDDLFEPHTICQTLQVAPSTYYASLARPPSARRVRDEELKAEISRVHKDNFDVYGVEKVWMHLRREGIEVGRDRVARLMAELELEGVVRGKVWRTTVPSEVGARPADLVERNFTATAASRLWVADLTYRNHGRPQLSCPMQIGPHKSADVRGRLPKCDVGCHLWLSELLGL